jgi:hypothetical protein
VSFIYDSRRTTWKRISAVIRQMVLVLIHFRRYIFNIRFFKLITTSIIVE